MGSYDRLIFIHSSDELYGADRILLDLFAALTPAERTRTELWLPNDVAHPSRPLCAELEARGALVRHLDLPVLRRAYRTPRAYWRLGVRSAKCFRELRSARAGLVYLTTSATFVVAPLARLAGAGRVVGHKQEIWSSRGTRLLGLFARACHQLIAISRPVRDDLPSSLRDRTAIVVNATAEPPSRQPLVGRDERLTFTVASRWNGWKGHRTLLAAWDSMDDPGTLVVLGGRPPSGDAVDVAELVAGLRRPDSVVIVGEVSDIGPYLDATDVVVVPSDEPEPFGLVAIEAFARGRPVIGSAAGGLADIITDDWDGWVFEPRSVGALAAVISGLDRVTVNEAGERAATTFAERFTAERYASEWRIAVGLDPGTR